jgi:hypothetical protein
LEFEIGKLGDFGIVRKEIEKNRFCLIFCHVWGMGHFSDASSKIIFVTDVLYEVLKCT